MFYCVIHCIICILSALHSERRDAQSPLSLVLTIVLLTIVLKST